MRVNPPFAWRVNPHTQSGKAGQRDVVGILLSRGADVNAKDKQGRTALWYAKQRSQRAEGEKDIEQGISGTTPGNRHRMKTSEFSNDEVVRWPDPSASPQDDKNERMKYAG
ncbi:hypothetical protein ES703_87318 [subsurface metagenome]